ncbi:MAG: mechanosensitive ion channel [Longimicrobiales bacterium]|nr:mechanosensitive ion channel [Longimicrobiales bacterium]
MSWSDFLNRLRSLADTTLFTLAGTEVKAVTIVTFILILLIAAWLSQLIQRVTERWLRSRGVVEEGTLATSKRLLHYSIILVGVGVATQTIGINLGTVFAAGAVVAVAFGFAMQNILQNFVSGLILLAERSITESDVLEVDGKIVRVVRMGARATVARTRDEEEIIIPNSLLVQSTVTNYTLGDSIFRVRAKVGVAYGSDMDQVTDVLRKAGESIPNRIEDRGPVILLLEFGDSSVVFEVSVWATDPWIARVTRSDLNLAIWRSFKEAGITIAFPQLDVHFDEGRGQAPSSHVPGEGS